MGCSPWKSPSIWGGGYFEKSTISYGKTPLRWWENDPLKSSYWLNSSFSQNSSSSVKSSYWLNSSFLLDSCADSLKYTLTSNSSYLLWFSFSLPSSWSLTSSFSDSSASFDVSLEILRDFCNAFSEIVISSWFLESSSDFILFFFFWVVCFHFQV